MLTFYPQLSGWDLVLCRAPGAGLGNLLFPWARAELYARACGGRLIAPTWRNLKLGPWLRREPDRRGYGDIFRHRRPGRAVADLVTRLTRRRISEDAYLAGTADHAGGIVTVRGLRRGFTDLEGHAEYLAARLLALSRHPLATPPSGFVALHIRRGDFAPPPPHYLRNSRIELGWFVDELQRLRSFLPAMPALVFTDDASGDVEAAFAGHERVSFAGPANALQHIFRMAAADHLVLSNSTFSLWAAFLGRGTVSTRWPELFADYGLDAVGFRQRIR
jgi:hypothetical protein